MTHFQKEYIKPNPPADVGDMMRTLTVQVNNYVTQVGQTIQSVELILRGIEVNLDLWNEWAACRRPFPPPKPDIEALVEKFRKITWPDPPGDVVDDLKKKAENEIPKVPGSAPGKPGARAGTRGTPRGHGPDLGQGFVISGSFQFSSVSMKNLNAYLGYLNDTWAGDVPIHKDHTGPLPGEGDGEIHADSGLPLLPHGARDGECLHVQLAGS